MNNSPLDNCLIVILWIMVFIVLVLWVGDLIIKNDLR